MSRGRLPGLAVLTAPLLVLGGCSLPAGGAATSVPSDQVPYGLVTATVTPSVSRASAASSRGTVYLVDSQQRLVPLQVEVPTAPLRPLVQQLLQRLALGPDEGQRQKGLLTDLAPASTLELQAIEDGTATIELQTAVQDPSPVRFPVAIGQVVLTATSVVGVDRVRFVKPDGGLANVPVPPLGGVTTAPVTSAQLTSLLAPRVVAPPRLVPAPGDDPVPSPSSTTTSG